jgi:hypothetical protein
MRSIAQFAFMAFVSLAMGHTIHGKVEKKGAGFDYSQIRVSVNTAEYTALVDNFGAF